MTTNYEVRCIECNQEMLGSDTDITDGELLIVFGCPECGKEIELKIESSESEK